MGTKTAIELSVDRLRSRLMYEPNTGNFRWLIARRDRVGMVAGKMEHHGYVQIVIDQRAHMAHRLAWLYMTGEWPEAEIDHKGLAYQETYGEFSK